MDGSLNIWMDASAVSSRGLKMVCTLIIQMPGTVKSNNPIKKYLELFEARYEKSQEVVVLGTLNGTLNNQPNHIAITATSRNSSKKSKKN